MQFVGKVISSVSEFYKDINPSTLSGAIDVIVVQDIHSGQLSCSPFHVRFGKLQLLRPQEKGVELCVNGVPCGPGLRMKVGEAGETFFVLPRQGEGEGEGAAEYLLTSPLIAPQTPVSIESIDEIKLVSSDSERPGGGGLGGEVDIVLDNASVMDSSSAMDTASATTLTTTNTTLTTNTTNTTNTLSTLSTTTLSTSTLSPDSPEWKWQWGDLPTRSGSWEREAGKELKDEGKDEEKDKDEESTAIGNAASESITTASEPITTTASTIEPITSTSTSNAQPTITSTIIQSNTTPSTIGSNTTSIELFAYLSGKDHLKKCFKLIHRSAINCLTFRLYHCDRGAVFLPHAQCSWEEVEEQLLMARTGAQLKEASFEEFLRDPRGIGEEVWRMVVRCEVVGGVSDVRGNVGDAKDKQRDEQRDEQRNKGNSKDEQSRPLQSICWLPGALGVVLGVGVGLFGRVIEREREFIRLGQQLRIEGCDGLDGLDGLDGESDSESESEREETITEKSTAVDAPSITPSIPIPSTDTIPATTIPSTTATATATMPTTTNATASSWKSWWSRSEKKAGSTSNGGNGGGNTSTANGASIASTSTTNLTTTPTSTTTSQSTPFLSAQSNSQSSLPLALNSPTPSSPHVIHRTSSPNPSVASIDSTTSSSATTSHAPPIQYIKSLRLPSHLLKQLNLRPGVNTITYTVNNRLQGTATCQSRIFLWRSDARVIVSDIDGTITKSDALGHLFTMVGKDWTHVGVASLYSKIAKNGYEFLYLTSRAIGQAASTRGYLRAVEQDRFQLPDGPVIMSPDRLFTALHREVIQRRPDEFKIACLRDIQRLFVDDEESVAGMGSGVISSSEDESMGSAVGMGSSGMGSVRIPRITLSASSYSNSNSNRNPFYAGFGNRPTDTKSYKAVGIPASRIFLINSTGDLKLDRLTFFTPYSASSYAKLTEEVDKVFPPLLSPQSLVREAGDEAFTDFQYWSGAGDGQGMMALVQQLLGSSFDSTGMGSNKKAELTAKPKQSEIVVPLPVGDGLAALSGDVSAVEVVAAVADARVIVSSPGRRRSESASRMILMGKRNGRGRGEGEEQEGDADAEEDSSYNTDTDTDYSDEGTSVNSITSYPFM